MKLSKEALIAISIVSGFFILIGFIDGAFEAGIEKGPGKCEYSRIIDFTPGHILGCELWRKRW